MAYIRAIMKTKIARGTKMVTYSILATAGFSRCPVPMPDLRETKWMDRIPAR